jgi:hypothetical protein
MGDCDDIARLVRENEAAIQAADEESERLRAAVAEARAFAAKTRGNLRGRWRRSAHAFYMLSMRLAIRDRHELKQGNRRLASELAEVKAIRREELAAHQVVVRRAIAAEGELAPLRELAEKATKHPHPDDRRKALERFMLDLAARARTALGRTNGD